MSFLKNINLVESTRYSKGWGEVKDAVVKHRQEKPSKYCKNKTPALKDTYKKAKDKNKKFMASPNFPQFYDLNKFSELGM